MESHNWEMLVIIRLSLNLTAAYQEIDQLAYWFNLDEQRGISSKWHKFNSFKYVNGRHP